MCKFYEHIIGSCNENDFHVITCFVDMEFCPLDNFMNDNDIASEICRKGEHIPEIEQQI